MKKKWLICFIVFWQCSGCAVTHNKPSSFTAVPVLQNQPSPTNSLDTFNWDFGTIPEGTVVRHQFSFVNKTAQPLTIKDVTTSCGCTASSIKNKNLAPGQQTIIEVTFDSKGYKGPTTQFVYVNTDDPNNPLYRFSIKGFVQ
ncbi:MAG: DUF1573 domain-containing protein [Candidatus Omnitrophica bacterium]|nr:DUF1573 domain-containing protein [Candidatus Omnitrophota bacterium]